MMISKRPGISAVLILAALGCASAFGQTKPKLDTTTFVVMGEGLAAGMANFGLSAVVQKYSFPAQIAAQMKTAFEQPLIQPPGIGDVIGYPSQEVVLQVYPTGSVRYLYQTDPPKKDKAPALFVMNLSVPGFTLADSVSMRPQLPVAQRNMKQTAVNMILGFPQLFLENVPIWNQFEYAKALLPTMVLIELGYYEALDAAVTGDPSRMPAPATFGATYSTVLAGLRALQTEVIATTIPNPIDTAYFSSPTSAAAITASLPAVILDGFGVSNQDFITRNGLMAIANQFSNKEIRPLPPGSVLTAAVAADITARVNALNAQIVTAARANGTQLYDLNAFIRKIRVSGATVGPTTLTADYLGGFYSMDAVYPGITGHALIANDILAFLNTTYGTSFPLVSAVSLAASDHALSGLKPTGGVHTSTTLGVNEGSVR